jgi:hypothetical protein
MNVGHAFLDDNLALHVIFCHLNRIYSKSVEIVKGKGHCFGRLGLFSCLGLSVCMVVCVPARL